MNKENGFLACDALVILDGENKPFRSYIMCEEVDRINEAGGLAHANKVNLRETEDRIIPDSLKMGLADITDIYVTMVPGKEYKP